MGRSKVRAAGKMLGASTVVALMLVAGAGLASVHISVLPSEAAQGSFVKLACAVPNELPDASTVSLRVQFPQDHPFAFVSVKPKAGWTATPVEAPLPTPIEAEGETITEAVTEITWSGGQIKPGEFDEFEVSVGPLPTEVDELSFPAVQTYSNGEEVAWIEQPNGTARGRRCLLPRPHSLPPRPRATAPPSQRPTTTGRLLLK